MNTLSVGKNVRLESLDFLRGLIMALLVLDSTGCYEHIREAITDKENFGSAVINQFFHKDWHGLHFWDLVQPLFMFMAGIAMAYSLSKQSSEGVLWKDKFVKIAKRSVLLLFFGLFPKPIIELITPSIQEILVHIK